MHRDQVKLSHKGGPFYRVGWLGSIQIDRNMLKLANRMAAIFVLRYVGELFAEHKPKLC